MRVLWLQIAREFRKKPLAVLRRDLLIATLGDLCLIPWASDRLPTPAPPSAVASPPQHSFLSSLKSALVAVAAGICCRLAFLCGFDEVEQPLDEIQHGHHDLIAKGGAALATPRSNAFQVGVLRCS